MNKSFPLFAVLLPAVLGVTGCSSEPTCDYSEAPYMSAQEAPSLKVPEGLTAPDHSSALVIPPANQELHRPAPGEKSRCLDRPPSYFATSQPPKETGK